MPGRYRLSLAAGLAGGWSRCCCIGIGRRRATKTREEDLCPLHGLPPLLITQYEPVGGGGNRLSTGFDIFATAGSTPATTARRSSSSHVERLHREHLPGPGLRHAVHGPRSERLVRPVVEDRPGTDDGPRPRLLQLPQVSARSEAVPLPAQAGRREELRAGSVDDPDRPGPSPPVGP